MKNVIVSINAETGSVHTSTTEIGVHGENENGTLIVEFFNGDFVDGTCRLETEKADGTKGYLVMTKDADTNTYRLGISSNLLSIVGKLKAQVRITKEIDGAETVVFKSVIFDFDVQDAIAATEEIPKDKADWCDTVDERLEALEDGHGVLPVVQEMGTATNKVMSQNAVTNEILRQTNRVDVLYTLLENTIINVTTVEDAYNTRVTADGLPVVDEAPTTVHKITGASVASTNLVDLSTARGTKNGIGYSSINNTYTFSGTLASSYVQIDSFALPSHLRGKTLTFSQTTYFTDPADTGCIYIKVLKKVNGETTKMGEASRGKFTLTLDDADAEYAIVIQTGNWVGSTIDGTEQISFMVNEGSTALPYSDYFPGIRHAAFCGIASAGRNLIASLVDKTESVEGITATANSIDGTVTINGKPTAASFNMDVSVNFYLPRGTYTIYAPHRTMRFAGWMVKSRKSGATVGKIDWARLGGVVSDTFTVTEPGEYYIRFFAPIGYDYPAFDNYVETPMILPGALTENFPPLETYHADTSFALTTPVTLGKWDTIDVDAGKRITGTVTETQDTPYTEEQLAQFDEYILSADGKTVIYRTAAPTETSLSVPKNYKAWHGGCEYITKDAAGGQNTDNLKITVNQDYYEEVSKA